VPPCNYATFTIQSIARCVILFLFVSVFVYVTEFEKTVDLRSIMLLWLTVIKTIGKICKFKSMIIRKIYHLGNQSMNSPISKL